MGENNNNFFNTFFQTWKDAFSTTRGDGGEPADPVHRAETHAAPPRTAPARGWADRYASQSRSVATFV